MDAEPRKEHRWLQQLVGEWTFEGEAECGPGQPPVKMQGSERVRSLGGLWTVGEGQGEMPDGGPATTIMTLGFDPAKERYVGTFIGSMMTHLWRYEGTLDAEGRTLTLDTEGPCMATEGKMARYRDVIEILGEGHRALSSFLLGDDGTWKRFMRAEYRRVK